MSAPSSTCEAENRFPFYGAIGPIRPAISPRLIKQNTREKNEETNSHVRNLILNKWLHTKGYQFNMNLSILDRLLLVLLAASAVQAGPHPQLRADLAYGRLGCDKKFIQQVWCQLHFQLQKTPKTSVPWNMMILMQEQLAYWPENLVRCDDDF